MNASPYGSPNGSSDGSPNGSPYWSLNGTPNSSPDGSPNGSPNGSPIGYPLFMQAWSPDSSPSRGPMSMFMGMNTPNGFSLSSLADTPSPPDNALPGYKRIKRDCIYGECQKNIAQEQGAYETDGCLQFIENNEGGTACVTCGCDKSYHEKMIYTHFVYRGGSPPPPGHY